MDKFITLTMLTLLTLGVVMLYIANEQKTVDIRRLDHRVRLLEAR